MHKWKVGLGGIRTSITGENDNDSLLHIKITTILKNIEHKWCDERESEEKEDISISNHDYHNNHKQINQSVGIIRTSIGFDSDGYLQNNTRI